MDKFEFKITKIDNIGKVWEQNIIIRANEKFDAFARIKEMFPTPEYEYEFIQTY